MASEVRLYGRASPVLDAHASQFGYRAQHGPWVQRENVSPCIPPLSVASSTQGLLDNDSVLEQSRPDHVILWFN